MIIILIIIILLVIGFLAGYVAGWWRANIWWEHTIDALKAKARQR